MISLIVACSLVSTVFKCLMYSGFFCSPVSHKIRLEYASKCEKMSLKMLSNYKEAAYRLPLPIKYVLVPCKVIGPGLHPKMRMRLLDSFVMAGIGANLTALIFACEVSVRR